MPFLYISNHFCTWWNGREQMFWFMMTLSCSNGFLKCPDHSSNVFFLSSLNFDRFILLEFQYLHFNSLCWQSSVLNFFSLSITKLHRLVSDYRHSPSWLMQWTSFFKLTLHLFQGQPVEMNRFRLMHLPNQRNLALFFASTATSFTAQTTRLGLICALVRLH